MKWLFGALVGGLLLVACLVVGEMFLGFEFSDRYSVLRGGADGAKALWLTLEQLGEPVVRLHEMPRTAGILGVLFLLLDQDGSRGFPAADAEELLSWVRDGNTLILAHAGPLEMLATLGLTVRFPEDASGDEAQMPASADTPTLYRMGAGDRIARFAPVSGATFRTPGAYEFAAGRAAVLLAGGRGPAAVVVAHGNGRVVLVSDPWALSNRGLSEPGNLELGLFLARFGRGDGGVVAFDELHHGMASERSVVGWLRRRGFAPLLVQALLVVVLAVAALRGRGERAPRASTPPGVGSADSLAAVGRIYADCDLSADAAHDLALDLERQVARCRPESELRAAAVALIARARGGRWPAGDAMLIAYHNEVVALERRLANPAPRVRQAPAPGQPMKR